MGELKINAISTNHPQISPALIAGVAPCFIVGEMPATVAFYRDQLGFTITFQDPPPNDFFAIVERDHAMLMLKSVGAPPTPNHTRQDARWGMRWDAFFSVPDPDALAEEFAGRNVAFFAPLQDTHDGLRGFELKDPNGYQLFFGRPKN